MRRLLVLVLLVAAIAVGPASAADPVRVAAFGDSLLWEARDPLLFLGGIGGATVSVDARGGAALCDARDGIASALRSRRVDVVVVAFTGNNLTPCVRDERGQGWELESLADAYANEAASLLAQARPGARVVWVLAPPNARPNPTADLVRDASLPVVRRAPGTTVVDGGRFLVEGGAFAATLPCLTFEPCPTPGGRIPVRAPDGAHLCPVAVANGTPCPVYSSGALRYALAILDPVVRGLRS